MSSQADNRDTYFLLKVYWGLILNDACEKTGLAPTKENKLRLHEAHKKIYDTESISGRPYEYVSEFIFTIVAWYASELGIFLRTSGAMPENIDSMPLSECWEFL
jgi:hypothetical protein